jgi:hypothetical protein
VFKLISPGQANSTVATCPNEKAATVNNQINAAKEPASNKITNGNNHNAVNEFSRCFLGV